MADFDKNVGGFLSGFSEQFFPAQRQNRMDFERQQMAEQARQMRDLQMQQMQQQAMQQDQARKTAGLMATGQLQGDLGPYGRTPEELVSKYGFNPAESLPIGYQTPQQVAEAQSQKRMQDIADFARREQLKAAINAKYKDAGKPEPYVVVENDAGVQQWIRKGQDIPEGFRVSKPAATTINVGGVEKPVPTEKTRLVTIAKSGLQGVDSIEGILFDKDGELDRSVLAALNAPLGAAPSGALGGKASQAYNQIVGAIRDKLRLESGAVISDDEMKREMQRYLPGVFDTKEVARSKLKALKNTLKTYLDLGGRGVISDSEKMIGDQPAPKTTKTQKPDDVDFVFNPETGEFE